MERQTLRWDKSLVLFSYAMAIIVPHAKTNTQSANTYWMGLGLEIKHCSNKTDRSLVKVGIKAALYFQASYSLLACGNVLMFSQTRRCLFSCQNKIFFSAIVTFFHYISTFPLTINWIWIIMLWVTTRMTSSVLIRCRQPTEMFVFLY